MKHLRSLILALVALTAMSASALDLPIKTVNGRQYYYYEVKAKDDLYTICRQLGVTRTDVVRNNPSVADGLRRGQTLYFPVGDSTTGSDSETVHLVKKGETLYGIANLYGVSEEAIISLNPGARGILKAGTALVIPVEGSGVPASSPVEAPDSAETPIESEPTPVPAVAAAPAFVAVESPSTGGYIATVPDLTSDNAVDSDGDNIDSLHVTIMLPFMLNEEKPSKAAQLYTEFFKGFMLAVDSLRDYGTPIVITALDTEGSASRVDSLLTTYAVSSADLIIGPDDDAQLNAIAAVAAKNGTNLLNIFAIKNQAYLTNPFVLQANIPHSNMYRLAVDALMNDFSEATPVMLQPTQGKSDKAEFQQQLRGALNDAGRPYIDISYSGTLHVDNLAQLDSAASYVFIPSSGTTTEFNRIYNALKAYKDNLNDMSTMHLFGYPEWITFRQDALDKVHYMNSTIYSRFFCNTQSPRSAEFAHTFEQRYGSPMLNAIPLQGVLGFDTGIYVIKALNHNLHADDNEFDTVYDGIQCDYRFVKTDNVAGRINNSLYFITFRPSGFVDKRSL